MRGLAMASLLLFVVLPVAACQLILGEHEIFGIHQSCSEDNDCDVKGGDICSSSYDGVCRRACTGETERVDCGEQADCSSSYGDGSCDDPLGTPCDPEGSNSRSCGGVDCLDRDDQKDLVLGYCTKSCDEAATPPRPCPTGSQGHAYLCVEQTCVLKAGS